MATTPSSSCWRAAAEQRLAVVELRRDEHAGAAPNELLEPRAPLRERLVDERLGLDLEQVEENEDGRAPPSWRSEKRERPLSSSAQISPSSTASEERIARVAARAHVDETAGEVVPVPARERHLAAGDRHDRAEAVPLRLEHPALARGSASADAASIGS